MAGRRTTTTHISISIGVAASRVGVHPQTLRMYERKGLVVPQRTGGGTRRYSEAELERLTRVQQLTEQGLSLAGVAFVLDLEDTVRKQRQRIEQLEQRLQRYEPDTPTSTEPQLPIVRSMSVELVHIPRVRRGPRWNNRES